MTDSGGGVGLRPVTEDDLAIVKDCERALHTVGLRTDRLSAGLLLHNDFREVGQSGRVWDKAAMLDHLVDETAADFKITALDLTVVALAPDVILATYDTETAGRLVHRSSVWVRADGRWQLRLHHGTPVTDPT